MKMCVILWTDGTASTLESAGDAFEIDINTMRKKYRKEPSSIGFYLDHVQIGVVYYIKEK